MSKKNSPVHVLKTASLMRKLYERFPKPDISGKNLLQQAKKLSAMYVDKFVNARGKGIRFIRKNGRIVPIRPKKG